MIYNRTSEDVEQAKKIIKEKVQKFQELTDAEKEILSRGTFTADTINRVERRQSEIRNIINDMGYWNTQISLEEWSPNDIFNVDKFKVFLDNTRFLVNAFFVYGDTPALPPVSYRWQDANAHEKILHDIDVMINDVRSNYRNCGTFEAGENI